jgi:hypothetical protein
MTQIEAQNKLLKSLLATTVEMLPRHTKDCGVWSAHESYGDKYCDCKIKKLKTNVRKLLKTV